MRGGRDLIRGRSAVTAEGTGNGLSYNTDRRGVHLSTVYVLLVVWSKGVAACLVGGNREQKPPARLSVSLCIVGLQVFHGSRLSLTAAFMPCSSLDKDNSIAVGFDRINMQVVKQTSRKWVTFLREKLILIFWRPLLHRRRCR